MNALAHPVRSAGAHSCAKHEFGCDRRPARRAPGHRLLAPLAALALAPALAAQGRTWTVDSAGGADHTEVADAVAAASDGDVVLVRPGTYAAPVRWSGKGLTVVGDGTGARLLGRLEVSLTTPDQAVALANLEVGDGFTIRDCAGFVHLQGILGPHPAAPGPIPAGLLWYQYGSCGIGDARHLIEGCPSVTLVDCELFGADGPLDIVDGGPGQHALGVQASTVAIHGGRLVGGRGADGDPNYGHGGGESGAGGDGLHVDGVASSVLHHGVQAVGGAGGSTTFIQGCPGLPIRATPPSAVQALTHPFTVFEVASVFRGGDRPLASVHAPPGAGVFVLTAPTGNWDLLGTGIGVLAIGSPRRVLPFGAVPASGVLQFALGHPGPATPSGSVELHYQALVVEPTRRYLSEPRLVTVVHASL